MRIHETMDLHQLAERMYVNGDWNLDEIMPTAHAMRALILADQTAYGWIDTSDIEDVDWFRMLESAAH